MATTSFDSWFHGGPLEVNIGDTKTFAYWFHGAIVLRPDITQITGFQSLTMRARIGHPNTVTFQARARVQATVDRTISLRAHIRNSITRTLDMRSRMSRQQGWPIMSPFDPGFSLFQPTQLNMRARITQGARATQTLDMRAKIRRGGTVLLTMRGRVVKAAYLTVRARIKPFRSRTTAAMIFHVSNASQTKALMLFYTKGNVYEQTMSMRARISKPYQTRVANTLVVSKTGSGSSVLTFTVNSDQVTLQQLRMGARIVAP